MLNIVGKRKIYFSLSGVLVALSLLALLVWGLKPGIDFTGGSLLELDFTGGRPEATQMVESLNKIELGEWLPQPVDESGYILKTKFITEDEHQQILSTLRENFETEENLEEGVVENKVIERRAETIGPAISSLLKKRSYSAAIAVMIAIVFYVAYAFRKVSKPVKSWKYGLTAIIALLHDVIITMGVFAVLGHFKGVEVDIPFVVALLTILGYSVNDTIVVFDRVRENLIKLGYEDFEGVVNKGVNGTLLRSLNTSVTTLLVLCALFFFGGASIHFFSLALIIGIISGTYSSIFLASPILVVWQKLGDK